MTAETVIVTGAGGPAGVSVIRALQAAGHKVVAIDADPLAVGLRLADDRAVVPRCDDRGFVDAVAEVAWVTGARALVATVAEEIGALSAAGGESGVFARAGLRTWLPDPAAVATCIDKWKFAEAMTGAGLPAPATGLGAAPHAVAGGSWIVKPRFGRGSRDVYVASSPADLAYALARVPDPIVQAKLDGREFTVDALVARDGTLAGAVPRWRIETKAGISTKGVTFADPALVDAVGQVLRAVRLTGPANVQGFVSPAGDVSFVEVNPRFSGGLPLSLAAGADLVGEYLRGVVGLPVRPSHLSFRPGVTMLRHLEEVFEQ
jgi:carbamoyl-phosphate synthase large subunit